MAGKKGTEGTLERRVEILRMLPSQDSGLPGLTVKEMKARLPSHLQHVSPRTIQRDLEHLQSSGSWNAQGIKLYDEADPLDGRGRRFWHAKESKTLLFRTPSDEDLTMLTLVEKEMALLLPPTVLAAVSPYLTFARDSAKKNTSNRSKVYSERLLVEPAGVQQIPPSIDSSHLQEITEALFKEEKLEIGYAASKHGYQPKTYIVHPIGLVKKGLLYFMVLVKDEDINAKNLLDKTQTFRIDRVIRVTRLRHDPVSPKLPSLADVKAAGKTMAFSEGLISLTLHIPNTKECKYTYDKLTEAPLSIDQVITAGDDGYKLTATVYKSMEPDLFLLGLAHQVRVVSPVTLREEVRRRLAMAINLQGM